MSVSEFVLLKRFATSGDAEAFAEIIRQHAPLVYGVCLRILADRDMAADAVQDTFLQLAKNADTITGSLPNWLHRVAKNRSIELIRQDSSRKQHEKIYAAVSQENLSQEETVTWQEISGCIDEELDKLDELTREVIILHFFESQTLTNIAEKFGISQPTVSRRIEEGITTLRHNLKSRGLITPVTILTALLTENIVKAAPASIMKELGKIALAGSKAIIGAEIAAGIAVKTKIMAGMLIVLLGAGLTVISSFIANGENKPVSTWDLVRREMTKNTEPNEPIKSIASDKTVQGERNLHFPKNRPIGKLAIGDIKESSELNPRHDFESIEWESIGNAQGDVKIPSGKVVRLTLASWTWRNPANLSVLKQLNPDDIYSLILSTRWSEGDVNPDDKCMPYVAYLTGLYTLNLYGADVSAKGLEYLIKLKALERLYCPDNMDDSAMTAVSKMTSLKTLYIVGNNEVTNKGLAELSSLKFLEHLGLNSVDMTDEGLETLSGFSYLKYLTLVGNFTNDAFKYLKNIKSLKSIQFELQAFDDRGMKYVSEITQLENFNAHNIRSITDNGIAFLRNMPNLKILDIGSAKLTDRAMLDLKEVTTLEYIFLPSMGITDEGLKNIGSLKNLRYIWVGATSSSSLTDDSLRSIGQLKNLESLHIAGTGFSDEGMKYIAQLPKLKQLWLFVAGTLTNQGLDELAKSESLTNIILGANSSVTISGVKSLNRLKNLKSLDIGDVHQDNSSVMDLSGLTELENLKITLHSVRGEDRKEIYDAFREQDLAFLSNLKNLTSITITGRGITDSAIKNLSNLKNLISISIYTNGELKLTDDSINSLTGLKGLYSLFIMDGHFTDKALEYISGMPTLRSLTLTSDIALSSKAIRIFKQKNPNVTDLQLRP